MSGEQQASSFGDPNAQPPTPKQTPTSTIFPSPVFQTPKQHRGSFDGSTGGWTPHFAEEYSVFNATPGNLRGGSGQFADFATLTSYRSSSAPKRQLSTGGDIAADIATHVNHFSPNLNRPLPPVDPAQRLSSSPALVQAPPDITQADPLSSSVERSSKKLRRATAAGEEQGQTATPPPSARKGERPLAPKPQTEEMHHEQSYGQYDFTGTPQQSTMGTFVTTPSAVFGFPMSGRATAPAFTESRPFWDPESTMSGMDMDFSGDVFQTPTPTQHRPMNSIDWARTNQMFQESDGLPHSTGQENLQQSREDLTAVSKSIAMSFDGLDQSMFATSYPTPNDDPFGITTTSVDPGLLFSRSTSSSMDAVGFGTADMSASSAPMAPIPRGDPGKMVSKAPMRTELRRSMSTREVEPARSRNLNTTSSPIKPSHRPGLSRSMSENRGRRQLVRSSATLPVLAPATKDGLQPSSFEISRQSLHSNRQNTRSSPPKSQLHSRLSSLTSIPESTGHKPRAEVKFTIDANGRARVETSFASARTAATSTPKRRSTLAPARTARWQSPDDDDDASSTDDEPIIIPSNNSSFALPDPLKTSGSCAAMLTQRRGLDEYGNSGIFSGSGDPLLGDPESEAETVMNEIQDRSGDALNELEKLRQTRSARGPTRRPRLNLGPSSSHRPRSSAGGFMQRSYSENNMSPTRMTETSLPTPSSDRGQGIRCLCNRQDPPHSGDGFMVQCESCEMWLHGRCVNITKRTLPMVYICAFCANTPNMRGGRMRDAQNRGLGLINGLGSATSPLAHKSFRSFR